MYYCRSLNGIIHYVHAESGTTARYRDGGKFPAIPSYKFGYFTDLLQLTNAERKELMKKTIDCTPMPVTETYITRNGLDYPVTCTTNSITVDHVTQCKQWLERCDNSSANLPAPDWSAIEMLARDTKHHEEEDTMYYDNCNDQDTNARQYIAGRLENLYSIKAHAMQTDFGLTDDPRPKTPKELIARITEGKFKVQEDKMERDTYCPIDCFRWRDPSVKEDKAGFDTALNTMKAAKTEIEDTIMVGTPADALTALKAFESKTFH